MMDVVDIGPSAFYVAHIPYGGLDPELLVGPYVSWDDAEAVRPAVEAGYGRESLGWDRIDVMEVWTSGDPHPGSRNAEFGLPADGAVRRG